MMDKKGLHQVKDRRKYNQTENKKEPGQPASDRRQSWIGAGTLIAGILLILAGIVRGETATVLTKAVSICLECIGIG